MRKAYDARPGGWVSARSNGNVTPKTVAAYATFGLGSR